MLIYSKERLLRVFTIKCEPPEGITSRTGAFHPVARLKWCLLPQPRAKQARHGGMEQTDKRGPVGWPLWPYLDPASSRHITGGRRERDGVYRVWASAGSHYRGGSPGHLPVWVVSLVSFATVLARLPSCLAVIYNSAPSEFAEIPKATAQIR